MRDVRLLKHRAAQKPIRTSIACRNGPKCGRSVERQFLAERRRAELQALYERLSKKYVITMEKLPAVQAQVSRLAVDTARRRFVVSLRRYGNVGTVILR
jgi:hypothetical protein